MPPIRRSRVALFALLYDQDLNTPISVFATDDAGNQATAPLDCKAFPKIFRRSRIEVSTRSSSAWCRRSWRTRRTSLRSAGSERPGRIVSDDQRRPAPEERRDDRRLREARPRRRCSGRAHSSSSATRRSRRCSPITARTSTTSKEIDQQVHLGFDLAVTAAVAVVAANDGTRRARRVPRHLRQLRDHRPRPRRAVALRATSRRWTSRPGDTVTRARPSAAAA